MTTPADPPPVPEQVIEQRLVGCGLSGAGFTVKYEDYLQSIEIVITPAAGVREEFFPCIREADGYEIVTFEDDSMAAAYSDYVSDLVRPQMLEDATAGLEQRGLLTGFPEKESFSTLELYAEALEEHSGLRPRTALRVDGETIVFDPPGDSSEAPDFSAYSNLLAVIMFAVARGDFQNFGSIGNERFGKPDGE